MKYFSLNKQLNEHRQLQLLSNDASSTSRPITEEDEVKEEAKKELKLQYWTNVHISLDNLMRQSTQKKITKSCENPSC